MLYFCLLLYVTLIYVRPAEIVPEWANIPFVDILTGISALIGAFSVAAKPRKVMNLPQDKLMLGFWAIIAISSFKVWFTGVYYAFLAFMPPVFVYFLIRASVHSQRQVKGLIYLLIALNVFLAVNGIVQYHTGVGLGDVGLILDRIYGTGIFNDPNDLGLTFVMSVPLVLLVIGLRSTWLLFRIFGIVVLGVILLAIYYTNSRGAIIGLGATMVVYSFVKFTKPKALIVAAVLLSIIAVAAPSRGGEITFDESSAQTRIQSWAEGWAMLKANPLTGVGYDQYTEYHYAVAHNSFVHVFAELGLIGTFIFVGMFYWYFKGLMLIPNTNTEFLPWRRALFTSAVGMCACAWFLSRQYVAIFYVLLALGASAVNLNVPPEQSDKLQTTQKDVVIIFGLTIFGILFVYFSIRTMAVWGGGG
jgi:putative inorganic carbon (hco3(-)) transporter